MRVHAGWRKNTKQGGLFRITTLSKFKIFSYKQNFAFEISSLDCNGDTLSMQR